MDYACGVAIVSDMGHRVVCGKDSCWPTFAIHRIHSEDGGMESSGKAPEND